MKQQKIPNNSNPHMDNATVKWLHFQIQELPQIFQETLTFEALR